MPARLSTTFVSLGVSLATCALLTAGDVPNTDFASVMRRMESAKSETMRRQLTLLEERYDLSDRPAKDAKMDRSKPIQEGVRVKLPAGLTWEKLAGMSPEQIRRENVFPQGFRPLPHANHPEGGMVFPKSQIDEFHKQVARDLSRFDLDFDIPEHFLPEYPPAIYLTTRPELGDVSQGKLVTLDNYYELFGNTLNPKQLDGLRLLLTPFPQQQFNATDDRRSVRPSQGVTCFDCHESELRGQALFFGKANCAACHSGPYFTDGLMHDLKAGQFYEPRLVNGRMDVAGGPVKTFSLRGIKDSPPYLHDGRLLTLDDTVEYFNLVLQLKLTGQEKKDLVAFMQAL